MVYSNLCFLLIKALSNIFPIPSVIPTDGSLTSWGKSNQGDSAPGSAIAMGLAESQLNRALSRAMSTVINTPPIIPTKMIINRGNAKEGNVAQKQKS